MRAAVYYGVADIRIEDVPDPSPGQGEVLLEIHAAGICGTDVGEYVHGPAAYRKRGDSGPSLIPGHEFSGKVIELGAGVSEPAIGTLVTSGSIIACGRCSECNSGHTNLCKDYTVVGLHRDGALAQYCAVPAAICIDVSPFGLGADTAALAQPMAIAVHAVRRARLSAADESVLIVGAGAVGALVTYVAASAGVEVTVVDTDAERLRVAEALGASGVLHPTDDLRLSELLRKPRKSSLVVFEASGTRDGFETAIGSLGPGGRLVLIGLQSDQRSVDLRRLTLLEGELIGTQALCDPDLVEALRLLSHRKSWADFAPIVLPLEQLVTEGIVPMTQSRSRQIKTLLDPRSLEPRPNATANPTRAR